MEVIAFTFSTTGIFFCVLHGTKTEPVLKTKNKLNIPANYSTADIVEWFETELSLILNREKPSTVTYKLTISNVNHNFVNKVFYGQAILNLLCAKSNIKIDHTSPSSIVTSKFNLPKGADLYKYIDELLESPGNPWDAKMKDTALMALNLLK